MQFQHPEILYFLFLLVIPILVHLFQLRKFKTEYFTNVKFLKELVVQTRKSSKIKISNLLAINFDAIITLIIDNDIENVAKAIGELKILIIK